MRAALMWFLDGFLFAMWLAALLLLGFGILALVAGCLALAFHGHPWLALLCALGALTIAADGYEDVWVNRHRFGCWRA